MKIVSWNVNSFRSVASKGAIGALIRKHQPDLIFMQEMKCTAQQALDAGQMYVPEIYNYGYTWYVDGSTIPGRHGVALLVKDTLAFNEDDTERIVWMNSTAIDPLIDPADPNSREARAQAFIINDILFLNSYSVNVRQDLSRVPNRACYDASIASVLSMWGERTGGARTVFLGDLNVVRDEIDYHGPSLNPNLAGMTDSERASFKNILANNNLRDAFRELHPTEAKYSYWSYRGYARDSNRGWRIDYTLVSPDLMEKVTNADILTDVYGSDHAPIILELTEEV